MDLRFCGLLFFCSGLAALGYQIAWLSRLEQALGGTTAALGVVLAAYMGGLGLGARLGGVFADRPGAVAPRYARLELGIGVLGLLAPWTLGGVDAIYAALHGAGGAWLKAGLAILALAPATMLMGATLPLVARAGLHEEPDTQRAVAWLYGMNTLGAVAGVLVAQFALLTTIGIAATSRVMALVNLLLATAAFAARGRLGSVTRQSGQEQAPKARRISAAVLLALIAGTLGMSLEIALSRALGMALGSTRHGFAVVLLAVLIGIGLGSLWVQRAAPARESLPRRIALGFALLGLSTCLVLWLHPWLLRTVFVVTQMRALDYSMLLVVQLLLCAIAVLPAALVLGALFPWLSRWEATSTELAGHAIGRTYFSNTVGGVLGSLLAALLLLPWLGTANLLRSIALAAALTALIASLRWRTPRLVASIALVFGVLVPNWESSQLDFNPTRLRASGLPRSKGEYQDTYRSGGLALLMAKDGRDAYVSVRTNENILQLKLGGKTDASIPNDMPTQLLLGAVPLLARPDARDVAIVGLGSGVTAAVAAGHPGIERVDVIEIEPLVVQAARQHFHTQNHDVLAQPYVRIQVEDARSWLRARAGEAAYDVLISEPSNPSIAGIANLFTLEHYRAATRALRESGVFLQWIQLYETDDWMLRSMVLTFLEAFPHVDLWWAYPSDLLLLGSRMPLIYDRHGALAAAEANPVLAAELWPHLQALDPIELFSRYLGAGGEVRALFGGGEILRDDLPKLAARAARNRYEEMPPFTLLRQLWQYATQRPDRWPPLAELVRPEAEQTERLQVAGARYLERLSPEIALATLAQASSPEAFAIRTRLNTSLLERQRLVATGLEQYPDHPLIVLELARLHLDAGDRSRAAQMLDELRLPDRWDQGQLALLRLRALEIDSTDAAERAVDWASDLWRRLPPRSDSENARSFALAKLVQVAPLTAGAAERLREFAAQRPYDAELALALAQAELQRGRAREALRVLEQSEFTNYVSFKPEWRRAHLLAQAQVDLPLAQEELTQLLHWFPEQARHPELQQLMAARFAGD